MIKKILCLSILGASHLFAYAQEKIIITGFPEKNFILSWKPVNEYAIKNNVPENRVDDLFRKQLINNIKINDENFVLVRIDSSEIPDFDNYNYSLQKNKRGKEYYGLNGINDNTEIKNLMKKYDAEYFVHFSQYKIYETISANLSPRIVHRIQYEIFNNNLEKVSVDKFEISGVVANNLRPEKLSSKYGALGNKLSKRLFIDLATIEKENPQIDNNNQTDTIIASNDIKPSKPLKIYEPKHGFGLSAGWGTAYGYGIEYSYLVSKHFDINTGIGFSFSGLRTGIGTRYFFKKDGSSPFIGTSFVYTSGLLNYTVNVNDVTGTYRNFTDKAIFFRGGYKFEQYNKLHMLTLGYGLPFDDKGSLFLGGQTSSGAKKFADMQALGGLEISYTLIFRIGK